MKEELTPEELLKIQEEKEMVEARKRAILFAKYFSELIVSLPDDFVMNQSGLDEVLETRTQELIVKIRESGGCLQDIISSIDLLGVVSSMTLNRCKNHTKSVLKELYKYTLGVYNPEEEMPIVEITDRVKKFQTES
jgi:hypothetical protein